MAWNFEMQGKLNEFGRQTIIFQEPIQSFRTISRIVECYTEVSVAGEGDDLGPCGLISIIQIATCDGMCFVFDLQCCPRLISEGGLKHLLETPNVIKVMHDCRGVSAALFGRFQIQLCNVFDTQCAQAVIQSQFSSTSAYDIPIVSLPYICERYSLDENKAAVFLKTYWRKIPVIEWSHRPLLNKTVCYAATRVLCLLPEIYDNMRSFIFPNSTPIFQKMVHLNIIYHIFPEKYNKETKHPVKRRSNRLRIIKRVEECINSPDGKNISRNIEKLLDDIKHTKPKSPAKSCSSCSYAPKTKRRKITRSDNALSTQVKGECSQPKTVGSKSTATEVKARRKMRKRAKANQTIISNSCTESGVKKINKRKCSSDEKLGDTTVSCCDTYRKGKGSESSLEVKKKVKFGRGCVIPTTSHAKVLNGRKKTKSFKESCAEEEPVNKRIKINECTHHKLVSDKDALHIKAMKNWMDYLDVCTNMEEAMKKSKCGSSSCEMKVYEESETDSECSKEVISAAEIKICDNDSEVGIAGSNFVCSRCSIIDGRVIKSKHKSPIDCPCFMGGFKIKPNKQKKTQCFNKEEEEEDKDVEEEVEEDQDKEDDDDEDENVKDEELLNAFPCALCNCKGTSPMIQFSEKKCVLPCSDTVDRCYKNDKKMVDHKCTCIDCWLLGAICSTNNEDDENNNSRKCVCGCSCLCSEKESSSSTCDKKKSLTSADTSAQKFIVRCCCERDCQATQKQAKIEVVKCCEQDSEAARRKLKTDVTKCCCGQDYNKPVLRKPMTDACLYKQEDETARRKAKTEAVNIEKKLRKTCWNRKS